MPSTLVDGRDQKFVLYEMFNAEELCRYPLYADFSRDMFDMVLAEAEKFGKEVIFPSYHEGDKEGARLEKDGVHVPKVFHEVYRKYCEAGWLAMSKAPEYGGQGFPGVISTAAGEWFGHNSGFGTYPGLTAGAAHLIEVFGTEAQKEKYVHRMNSGEWGGTMALTEPEAGSDVGNLKTKASRQPDGYYLLQGTKQFITAMDQDLTTNIINPVLARIEGDPPGTKGISIFLVPKFFVNDDGSLGRRNDYFVAKIEEKMGLHGSATCQANLGDNNECYAELLGEERAGMKVMFQMMNEARIGTGMQGFTLGSAAYLHALQYTKDRKQGSSLLEMKNPAAPRVTIIQHPDVRRMLLWMKSQVEGMRALLYYSAYLVDMEHVAEDPAEKQKYTGLLEVLTPICKAYCSDIGFRVTETAMQCYGGYGYCAEYPVEQFMRDAKIASIYEGTNGIQALDLVGRKLGLNKGMYFMALLGEMNAAVAKVQGNPALKDLAADVQAAVDTLADVGMYFAKCGAEGKFFVPLVNSYPFLMIMGKVVLAWLHLWQAGVAKEKLDAICGEKGVASADAAAVAGLVKDNAEAAFYSGKLYSARYFIKHVLPEIEGEVTAIKSEDVSPMEIAEESFAS
jgi:alkylation response protein AidB-like acyl-CoA dehydrogenase